MLNCDQRREVLAAYVETALWTATNEAGEGFNGYHDYTIADLDPSVADEIRSDVKGFLELVEREFGADWDWEDKEPSEIGYDFYLTAAHHGAGFWDGDWQNGFRLTELSRTFTPPHIELEVDGVWWSA